MTAHECALGGEDTVSGLAGADVICLGDGDDFADGGGGGDVLFGEGGNDRLVVPDTAGFLAGDEGFDTCRGGTPRSCELS